jgi:hypothetical protein
MRKQDAKHVSMMSFDMPYLHRRICLTHFTHHQLTDMMDKTVNAKYIHDLNIVYSVVFVCISGCLLS